MNEIKIEMQGVDGNSQLKKGSRQQRTRTQARREVSSGILRECRFAHFPTVCIAFSSLRLQETTSPSFTQT